MSAPLDRRVLKHGEPVSQLRLLNSWSWFIVRRADGPAGVVLEVRIPGYLNEDQPHPDQGAAREAAETIYAAYCQAVRPGEQELSA